MASLAAAHDACTVETDCATLSPTDATRALRLTVEALPRRGPKMMTNRQGFIAVVAVAAVLVCWAGTALAQPFPGGLPQCQRSLNTCNANLATCTTQLSACQAAAQQFPATGLTTCSNSTGQFISCAGTGQDGEIQAGGTLSYTDNGNGTITDNNTKLVWEKKSADGTIHDVNTLHVGQRLPGPHRRTERIELRGAQ